MRPFVTVTIEPFRLIITALIRYFFRGGKEIRTPDPLHAMQVLYQLSYTPEGTTMLAGGPLEATIWCPPLELSLPCRLMTTWREENVRRTRFRHWALFCCYRQQWVVAGPADSSGELSTRVIAMRGSARCTARCCLDAFPRWTVMNRESFLSSQMSPRSMRSIFRT